MEGELQDQGQLDQDLEEWLSPRGVQPDHSFFSEEQKKWYTHIEGSAPEGATKKKRSPQGEISNMVVLKLSEKVEVSGYNTYATLFSGLYQKEDGFFVPWSGTDPYSKMNCFNYYKQENDWIIPWDHYNKEFRNWQGSIHSGQLRPQTLKEKIKTEDTCTKYAGSANFNGISREGKT